MARSKVKGTNGKPVKTGTNRDKLKASLRFDHKADGSHTVTERNDGHQEVVHSYKGRPNHTTMYDGSRYSANPIQDAPKNSGAKRVTKRPKGSGVSDTFYKMKREAAKERRRRH